MNAIDGDMIIAVNADGEVDSPHQIEAEVNPATVIDGEIESENDFDGDLPSDYTVDGEVGIIFEIQGGGGDSPYTGRTTVTPSRETQVLQTAGFSMERNIVVNPIPQNYGLITWNGATLTVS